MSGSVPSQFDHPAYAAFRPVFEIATTREVSDVVLINSRPRLTLSPRRLVRVCGGDEEGVGLPETRNGRRCCGKLVVCPTVITDVPTPLDLAGGFQYGMMIRVGSRLGAVCSVGLVQNVSDVVTDGVGADE